MSTTFSGQDHSEPTATSDSGAAPGRGRPELRRAIEDVVESGFIGVSLRVRDERGEWVGSAGLAELGGTAAPPVDGHVRVGSSTKTFTAVLVLQLVGEGRVGLDSPVADHLPGFGLDRRVTVRMLLQHTSGLFNFTGEVYEDGTVVQAIPIPYGASGGEWLENRFRAYRPEVLVREGLSRPARFEPGTGWSYSNTNYVLARLLVEAVTGCPVGAEMRRRVLEPLGLSGTVVPDSPEIPEPCARAYYRYEEAGEQRTVDVTRQNPSWVSSGGDMISTTRDLCEFFSALNRGELLPAELLAEMRSPRPTGLADTGYGLGVFVGSGGAVISHNGASVGHSVLMCGSLDGGTTLSAALNYVDDESLSIGPAFAEAQRRLVDEVFAGGAG
ncbi:D-alanyl-D-alanine carboxypeptidase [Saccharopolyspora kobensis]|uniref:D-alanyl-D-alanine carboxypeptidase n=1 Tax=Saccharopolyspora kobensis TaxID=146035 RepID=A0A1H5WJ88_9PSEU|nr:serine hydrolase domain-containing protein [Saccharopolyspora kobensis]SEF99534.1 D-alanyl-D-alanine carboxypeptidase [Saccharopolyspora kobensis]SFD76341.1 D-alanyl-D-alanine carboxypeptidase [Saccharopolyspora kobensis]